MFPFAPSTGKDHAIGSLFSQLAAPLHTIDHTCPDNTEFDPTCSPAFAFLYSKSARVIASASERPEEETAYFLAY
jgi:hypothetical protein